MTKKLCLLLALLVALPLLSGCRARITAPTTSTGSGQETRLTPSAENAGEGQNDGGFSADNPTRLSDEAAESSAQTTENPKAEHREYDESASAQAVQGANHLLHLEGEGTGLSSSDPNSAFSADRLHEQANRTVTQTVPAENADRKGTSEDAEASDTFLVYYTVLLKERADSLFECKRQYLYWEMPEDYLTIHKTSNIHQMILQTGCYDVSAKLLEENLTVTPGWVQRKNPGVIVKVVDRSVLGFGVTETTIAAKIAGDLLTRPDWTSIDAVKHQRIVLISEELLTSQHLQTAAMLIIAQTAVPELFQDIDPKQVLRELSQEAAGAPAEGILFFRNKP